MGLIDIQNLSHRFSDGTFGLRDITLSIEEGSFTVVAGANGSGKSTLFRHLNGLLLPHDGTVLLDGRPVADDLLRARLMVGMVFQDADSQIIGETVYDDVAFGPENLRLDRREIDLRVTEALQIVGLGQMTHRSPHLLSGGEKRRLAIAGVLAMRPRILVFDEPFSNLDYHGVRQVLRQVVRLHQGGHTVLLSTHDLEKVIAHTQRLVVLSAGRVVRDGRPEQVAADVAAFGIRVPHAIRLGTAFESWLN